jgi:hypothetical protein
MYEQPSIFYHTFMIAMKQELRNPTTLLICILDSLVLPSAS